MSVRFDISCVLHELGMYETPTAIVTVLKSKQVVYLKRLLLFGHDERSRPVFIYSRVGFYKFFFALYLIEIDTFV